MARAEGLSTKRGQRSSGKMACTGDLNVGDNYQRKGKLKLQVRTNSQIVLSSMSVAHVWGFEGEQ